MLIAVDDVDAVEEFYSVIFTLPLSNEDKLTLIYDFDAEEVKNALKMRLKGYGYRVIARTLKKDDHKVLRLCRIIDEFLSFRRKQLLIRQNEDEEVEEIEDKEVEEVEDEEADRLAWIWGEVFFRLNYGFSITEELLKTQKIILEALKAMAQKA